MLSARLRSVLAMMSIVVVTSLLAGCGDSDENAGAQPDDAADRQTLRIGYSGALSGDYAAYDEPILRGMEFAAEQLNAEAGPVEVEIDFSDNRGDQAAASTDVQRMIDEGITTFVVTTGDANVAQGQLISQVGGVTALGGSTAPTIVRDVGERAFLFAFGDNGQSAAMAQYACDQGYETAYTIGSPEIPYTAETPRYFRDAFAELCGGEIVGTDTYDIGQTAFATQVSKIEGASRQPDVIFSPMFVPDSGAFLKQLRGAGVEIPYLGLDGNDNPLYQEAGGSAVDGTLFSTHAFPQDGNAVARFEDEFASATGKAPESVFEALGRDHVYAFVDAVRQAGSTEPEAMAEAIKGFEDLELVTGELTMDPETRVPRKEVWLVEMKGTKPTLKTSFVPDYIPEP